MNIDYKNETKQIFVTPIHIGFFYPEAKGITCLSYLIYHIKYDKHFLFNNVQHQFIKGVGNYDHS